MYLKYHSGANHTGKVWFKLILRKGRCFRAFIYWKGILERGMAIADDLKWRCIPWLVELTKTRVRSELTRWCRHSGHYSLSTKHLPSILRSQSSRLWDQDDSLECLLGLFASLHTKASMHELIHEQGKISWHVVCLAPVFSWYFPTVLHFCMTSGSYWFPFCMILIKLLFREC